MHWTRAPMTRWGHPQLHATETMGGIDLPVYTNADIGCIDEPDSMSAKDGEAQRRFTIPFTRTSLYKQKKD